MARALSILLSCVVSAAPYSAGVAADFAAPVAAGGAPSPSVWLGHFSGGRNLAPGADPMPIDWVDVKLRFASSGACARWQKDMRRAYPTYEGWTTCLLIR